VVPIGKSSQGRPIHVIKLSRSRQPDGVEPSQKKAILVDAGAAKFLWSVIDDDIIYANFSFSFFFFFSDRHARQRMDHTCSPDLDDQ
jgi:hypothetical protein